jgi:subtilisin family serine protease
MLKRFFLLGTVLLISLLPRPVIAAGVEPDVYSQLQSSTNGRAYVIVLLTQADAPPAMSLGAVQAQVAGAQARVLSMLPPGDFEPVYLYENIYAMTGWITSGGLGVLETSDEVVSIGPDQRIRATLDSSVPNIRADEVQALGITGRGITVAVLDTGIDTDHPDLSDNIAAGAYTFLNAGATQVPGAEDDNGHGTAASGVITSKGAVAPVGVAPDTDILAIKVLGAGGSGWVSDWVAGINYVVSVAGNYDNLCAISMSLGSSQLHIQCPCDQANTVNLTAAAAVAQAKNVGITCFAASGNDGFTDAMSSPACITDVVAVAATYDGSYGQVNWSACTDVTSSTDKITCFTNRSPCNNMAAPGAFVTTPSIGGGAGGFGGTSAATPHCAGVAALMCQLSDSLALGVTPDQVMQILRATGEPTFDPAGTTPNPSRVNAFFAVGSLEPGPAPTASGVDPGSGFVGVTADVIITGANFAGWTDADFGDGTLTNSVTTISSDSLLVSLYIDEAATLGLRDVIVRDPFNGDTLTSAFEVLPTTRHYVSSAGSQTYPYYTAATAAHSIVDALVAAADGDTVLVDSLTQNGVSLLMEDAVSLSGGWMNNFTTRDLSTKKTTLNLGSHILINSSTGTAGLDGFVIQNGTGSTYSQPLSGKYGGAIWMFETDAAVTNCEIRLNEATNVIGGFGGGGGIYAIRSTVDISDNEFYENTATRGGAVYLYDCDGNISGNTIENNTVLDGGGQNAVGAIALEDCNGVTLVNNDLAYNVGDEEGAGVWINNCTGVVVDGGSVAGHSGTFNAGGMSLHHSDATVTGVLFEGNSGLLGGAVTAQDTSDVTIQDCKFDDNGALLGAGVYAQTGSMSLLHNLFVNNTASNTGGAAVVASPSGQIIGNTADRNGGAAGAGGFEVGDALDVFNNVVTNSTGIGIRCTGTPGNVDYNLVWNSSGSDYDGCGPGPGAATGDPLFADTASCDYRLTLHSPAIDTGDPDGAYNDPDGSRGDMGRYGSHAFVMEQPSFVQNPAVTTGGIEWLRNPEGDVDFYAVYCDSVSGFAPSTTTFYATTQDTMLPLPTPTDTLYYRVSAVDTSGYAGGYSAELLVAPGGPTDVPEPPTFVDQLQQNIPNPFNPTTTIRFSISRRARVTLVIYDVAGRRVRILVDDERDPNRYAVTWDGRNAQGARASSGIYFYRLEAGGFSQTRKMVLLK